MSQLIGCRSLTACLQCQLRWVYKMMSNKKALGRLSSEGSLLRSLRHLEDSLTVFQHTSACKTSQDDGGDGD
ncbi:hypothetical protein A8V49_09410 [Yersinia pestis]|nr:hypothetical protein A8V49_09410 [Yersinia pestis]